MRLKCFTVESLFLASKWNSKMHKMRLDITNLPPIKIKEVVCEISTGEKTILFGKKLYLPSQAPLEYLWIELWWFPSYLPPWTTCVLLITTTYYYYTIIWIEVKSNNWPWSQDKDENPGDVVNKSVAELNSWNELLPRFELFTTQRHTHLKQETYVSDVSMKNKKEKTCQPQL